MYNGHVFLWNYNTQGLVKSFEVSDQPVRAGKFVPRKQWIIAGSDDMQVRVYNYNTMEKVKTFEAHSDYIRWAPVVGGWRRRQGEAATHGSEGRYAAWRTWRSVVGRSSDGATHKFSFRSGCNGGGRCKAPALACARTRVLSRRRPCAPRQMASRAAANLSLSVRCQVYRRTPLAAAGAYHLGRHDHSVVGLGQELDEHHDVRGSLALRHDGRVQPQGTRAPAVAAAGAALPSSPRYVRGRRTRSHPRARARPPRLPPPSPATPSPYRMRTRLQVPRSTGPSRSGASPICSPTSRWRATKRV